MTDLPAIPLLPPEPLQAVVTRFYDLVYTHPWIGRFFADVDQRNQETKLVRFLQMSWDDRAYPELQAQYLRQEHAHMYVTEELFELRQVLFSAAVRDLGHGEEVVRAFEVFHDLWRAQIVKRSLDECSDMFTAIVEHPRPAELESSSTRASHE